MVKVVMVFAGGQGGEGEMLPCVQYPSSHEQHARLLLALVSSLQPAQCHQAVGILSPVHLSAVQCVNTCSTMLHQELAATDCC